MKIKNLLKYITMTTVIASISLATITPAHAYYTQQWEMSQKQEVKSYYISQLGKSNDLEAQARVSRIGNQVAKAADSQHPENQELYDFTVTQERGFNAFSTLGANIFISPVAVKEFINDNMLAFALAHEVGHQEKWHNLDKMNKKEQSITFGKILVTAVSGNSYNKQKDTAQWLNILRVQILNKYSKGHEQEADKLGFEYITKAGFNSGGGAAAFLRMKKVLGDSNTSGLSEMLTSLVAPDPHESNRLRYQKQLEYMKNYSGGRVEIREGTKIYVDGVYLAKGYDIDGLTAEEDACLLAGRVIWVIKKELINPVVVEKEVYGNKIYVVALKSKSGQDEYIFIQNPFLANPNDKAEDVVEKLKAVVANTKATVK